MTKKEAIAIFGSMAKTAAALKIWPSSITQWNDEKIPELRAYQIRELLEDQKASASK